MTTRCHDGWIDLGECKWMGRAAIAAAAAELQRRIAAYPAGERAVRGHLFVRRAPSTTKPPTVQLHDLATLYGDTARPSGGAVRRPAWGRRGSPAPKPAERRG